MASIIAEIWVCDECMIARENGDVSGIESESRVAELWSKLPTADVSNWGDSETGEGIHEFSSTPCAACGTRLAGYRERYAVWNWGK